MELIYLNQETLDFDLTPNGDLKKDNFLLTELFMRLATPKGTYIYDRDFGSTLPYFKNRRQKASLNEIQQGILDALNPVLVRGDIKNVDFKLLFSGLGTFKIELSVLDAQGNFFVFPYTV